MVNQILGSVCILAFIAMAIHSIINPEQAVKYQFGYFFRSVKPTQKDLQTSKVSGYVSIPVGIYMLYRIWSM
ncbi:MULTISPECIES: hypothetical protein [unclassified Paenibacillus]|uniref:hypothetical protein n=1 Tax=unclassified Paenibacillus TaxID=185978 RepID=UPI003639B1CC